jgi:hypothetical protein
MKMLPPKKLRNGERTLETEYFKPKEYTSRDFPRLIEGLGQQIRRDLDQVGQQIIPSPTSIFIILPFI